MSEPIRRLVAAAREHLAGGPFAIELDDINSRLDGPLRVALAGRVKAGKSTLLNALVGERLAPTDAGECTTIVSWYHEGLSYEVAAIRRDGTTATVPFTRRDGALVMDIGRLDPAHIERLDVSWPSSALRQLTLVDTPGLASLHDEHSARTREFLAMGDDRPSDADAVIYLMRHLHQRDAEFLGAFCDRGVVASSPVNAIGVLSRADEIGAGRLDAIDSAERVAARYAASADVQALCATVIPVAGLLAETGQTWQESEAAAIRTLAATPIAELALMLVSADEFVDPAFSELTIEQRRVLLSRLGMFGVRFLVTEVTAGRVATAGDMSRALVAKSGLAALRDHIDRQLMPRAQVLKDRSAIVALRDVARRLQAAQPDSAQWLAGEVERVEALMHEFGLLRAGHLVATGMVSLRPDERAEVAGAMAGAPVATERADALEGLERWRTRGADPLADGALTEVAQTMARSYEAAYAALDH